MIGSDKSASCLEEVNCCSAQLVLAVKYLSTVDVVLCQGFGGYRFQTVKVDLAKEIVPELHFLPVAPQHRGLLIAILLL